MKRITAALLALAFVSLAAAPAFAQDETPTKFYDFREHMVDGEIKGPSVEFTTGGTKATFKRIGLIGKKSMRPKLMETVDQL